MEANPVTRGIYWSRHALERWAERFPDLDRKAVFGSSVAASRKVRGQIQKKCQGHRHTLADWIINQRGALFNKEHKIAFIIGFHGMRKKTVITVFSLSHDHKE